MIHTILPYNNVISYMKYSNEVITIGFKKTKGVIQERVYAIDMLLAYKLFYTKNAADTLTVFNKIKKECRVIEVKNNVK